MIKLPDVNVLIALFDPTHVHHPSAQNWFTQARTRGWATCPFTENGFVRIVTNPAYPNVRISVAGAVGYLHAAIANNAANHRFWPDDVSLYNAAIFNLNMVQGHRQLTDLYLLGLCQQHNGTFVTFDAGVTNTARALVAAHAQLIHVLI